jgi:bifunctional non-homologous end joining protein LigD
MLWDKGTYDTKDRLPARQQLARGQVDLDLHGAKLSGGFAVARTGKRSSHPDGKEPWLLIKHDDKYGRSRRGTLKISASIAPSSRAGV